jgi:hypothetical protein
VTTRDLTRLLNPKMARETWEYWRRLGRHRVTCRYDCGDWHWNERVVYPKPRAATEEST